MAIQHKCHMVHIPTVKSKMYVCTWAQLEIMAAAPWYMPQGRHESVCCYWLRLYHGIRQLSRLRVYFAARDVIELQLKHEADMMMLFQWF